MKSNKSRSVLNKEARGKKYMAEFIEMIADELGLNTDEFTVGLDNVNGVKRLSLYDGNTDKIHDINI